MSSHCYLSTEQSPYVQVFQTSRTSLHKDITLETTIVDMVADGKPLILSKINDQDQLDIIIQIQQFEVTLQQNSLVIQAEYDDQIEIYIQKQDRPDLMLAIILSRKEQNMLHFLSILKNLFKIVTQETINHYPELCEKISIYHQQIFIEPVIELNENKFNYFLQRSGYILGEGFKWAGSKVSKGTDMMGNCIKNKLQSGNVNIPENRKLQVQNQKQKVKGCCSKCMNLTERLLTPVSNLLNKQVLNFQIKAQNSQNTTVKQCYQLGKSTNKCMTSAYRGLTSCISKICGSVSNNTKEITEKKFGQQFNEVYLGAQNTESLEQFQVQDQQQIQFQQQQKQLSMEPQIQIQKQQQYIQQYNNSENSQNGVVEEFNFYTEDNNNNINQDSDLNIQSELSTEKKQLNDKETIKQMNEINLN